MSDDESSFIFGAWTRLKSVAKQCAALWIALSRELELELSGQSFPVSTPSVGTGMGIPERLFALILLLQMAMV